MRGRAEAGRRRGDDLCAALPPPLFPPPVVVVEDRRPCRAAVIRPLKRPARSVFAGPVEGHPELRGRAIPQHQRCAKHDRPFARLGDRLKGANASPRPDKQLTPAARRFRIDEPERLIVVVADPPRFEIDGARGLLDNLARPDFRPVGVMDGPGAGEKAQVSRLGGGDNIGYIIPNEEIDLFLADVADGRRDGKPTLFDQFQKLENTALRGFLRLDKAVEGIAVLNPESDDPDYPLKRWDVVTRIGTAAIDNEGMIKLGDNLRVFMQYEVQRIVKDGKVPLTVLRDGQELAIEAPVPSTRPLLLRDLRGSYPSYFIYGPMVFSTATVQLAGGVNNVGFLNLLAAHGSPLVSRRGQKPAFPGEELVVVPSPFFPHRLVKGYGPPTWQVIEKVNDTPIKNLRHLVEVLRDSKDEFLRLSFVGANQETLVFRRKEMADATEGVLNDNGVRAQGSADTMEVWNARP